MKKALILTRGSSDDYNIVGRAILNAIASRYPSVNFRMLDVAKMNTGMHFQLKPVDSFAHRLANKLEIKKYEHAKNTANIDDLKKIVKPYIKSIEEHIKFNIKSFEPNVIICTHIFPAVVLSDLRAKGDEILKDIHIVYVECNYAVSPYLRIATNLDYYFCPTIDAIKAMKKFGIKDETKCVCLGIPLISKLENLTPQIEARELLNMPRDKYTILITNGSAQTDHTAELVKSVSNKYPEAYIVVLCNKNIKLKEKLTKMIKHKKLHNIKVWGQCNNLGILLSASDVILGKTTGVEVAQAVAKGIPYISTLKLTGQTLDNLKYLKKKGVVVNGRTIREVSNALDQVMKSSRTVESLLKHAREIYQYNATDELVKFLYHNLKAKRAGA